MLALLKNIFLLYGCAWLTSQCAYNEYSFFGCHLCSDDISNCITCSSGIRCDSCEDGYKLGPSGFLGSRDCEDCGVDFCDVYTTNCNCQQCAGTYYLANTSNQIVCLACGSTCICSSSYCVDCVQGYYLTYNAGQPDLTFCLECPTGCATC